MKVLITGASGNLGKELLALYPGAVCPGHKEMDVASTANTEEYVRKTQPDLVIHCAALTGIKQCEDNKELAWKINVQGTENLVKACERFAPNAHFAYISTACVFYGDRGNYTEEDVPNPKNFYALTKLLGEFVVKYSKLKFTIIRTNFVARKPWPYPKAFTDRWGTYLFADNLAAAIRDVISRNILGIVHVCGKEKMSMFELAKITTPGVQPTTLGEYVGPPLTKDMTLKSVRINPFEIRK